MYYYLDKERKPHGPYTPDQLRELLVACTITSETEIAQKGDEAWKPLREVFPDLAAEAPALPQVETSAASPAALEQTDFSFIDCVSSCFRQYAVFSGRSTRKEIWSFSIFSILLQIVLSILSLGSLNSLAGLLLLLRRDLSELWRCYCLISLAGLLLLLPSLAVSVRRLHDTGRSGWHVFWSNVIPFIGLMLVFFALVAVLGAAAVMQMTMAHETMSAVQRPELPEFSGLAFGVLAAGCLTLLVGSIYALYVYLIAFFFDSEKGTNKYGPSPKYPDEPKN